MVTDFGVSRKSVLAELKRENGMRKKVYGRGKLEQMSVENRRRYDVTVELEEVLGAMTDAEWNRFVKRKNDLSSSVATLF